MSAQTSLLSISRHRNDQVSRLLCLTDNPAYARPTSDAQVDYASFVYQIKESAFIRDPEGAVGRLTRRLQPQLPALRQLMRKAAPDLLFEEEGSRVGHNMLLEYARECAPPAAALPRLRAGGGVPKAYQLQAQF